MGCCGIIFGGTGYIGVRLALYLRQRGWDRVVLADIKPPAEPLPEGVDYAPCDVRQEVVQQIGFSISRQFTGSPATDSESTLIQISRAPGMCVRMRR